MSTAPLVTVAVPTRNRAGYLRACLASIRAQTYPTLEILVGDNASSDETPAVIRAVAAGDARVRALRHERNLGMVGNWNALLAAARGEFFLLLSDDDLLLPQAVEHLVAACRAPGVVFAYCPFFIIDGAGAVVDVSAGVPPARESGAAFAAAHLEGRRSICPAAMLYRLPPDGERLRYDESIGAVCDLLHRLTLATRGDVAGVAQPMVSYRVHESNETGRAAAFVDSLIRLARAAEQDGMVLRPVAPAIRAHVADIVSALATTAAVRGRAADAWAMVAALAAGGFETKRLEWRLRLTELAPLRAAARVRRWWLARRAARQASRLAAGTA